MGKNPKPSHPDWGTLVTNYFVRGRNVLLSRADFSNLYAEYYEHLKQHDLDFGPDVDEYFKSFLAAFVLHSGSRPRNEVLAWTIHFSEPLLNLFFGSDTELSTCTGRAFVEAVKQDEQNLFYQEQVVQGKPPHQSIVSFDEQDTKSVVETYYLQSEQRPARLFHLGQNEYVFVTAHPDFDEAWFKCLTLDEINVIDERETLSKIETRNFRWFCGCHHDKILDVLAPVMKSDPDCLFGDDELIQVNCPRCGARYRVSRESMEDKVARFKDSRDS